MQQTFNTSIQGVSNYDHLNINREKAIFIPFGGGVGLHFIPLNAKRLSKIESKWIASFILLDWEAHSTPCRINKDWC